MNIWVVSSLGLLGIKLLRMFLKKEKEGGIGTITESIWPKGDRYHPTGAGEKSHTPISHASWGLAIWGYVPGLYQWRGQYAFQGLPGLQMCKRLPTCNATTRHKHKHWVQMWVERKVRIFFQPQLQSASVSGTVSPHHPLCTLRTQSLAGPAPSHLRGLEHTLLSSALSLGTTWWPVPPLLPGESGFFLSTVLEKGDLSVG